MASSLVDFMCQVRGITFLPALNTLPGEAENSRHNDIELQKIKVSTIDTIIIFFLNVAEVNVPQARSTAFLAELLVLACTLYAIWSCTTSSIRTMYP